MSDGARPAPPPAGTGRAFLHRRTAETEVRVAVDLAGAGCEAATGDRFLDHMLATLARYAGMRIEATASGDLQHHLVEDVAIVLGRAFRQAFGQPPCHRIAHDVVPMDDALVACAVDLVDRPYYEGRLPVPIWEHFFRSFATEARINLHLEHRRGRDVHHVTEACFKALGRSLRTAMAPRTTELSLKGVPEET